MAVRWPVEAEVSKVTMASATVEPELSFTAPSMEPAPAPLNWSSADCADIDHGRNIIQRATARRASIGRNAYSRNSFAVRAGHATIRKVVIFSCLRVYTSRHLESGKSFLQTIPAGARGVTAMKDKPSMSLRSQL